MDEPSDEEKRTKRVLMGPAELRPFPDEPGHVALYRPLYVDGWDDQKGEFVRIGTEEPVGPLAVFRRARQGESVDMRTFDPISKSPLDLHCVWDPSHTFMRGSEQ